VAYPFSRYIDPNHSDILHEAHTVYRVERRPHWNLRPGNNASRSSGSTIVANRIGYVPNERPGGSNFTREEWLVEIQRQKLATAELLKLNQKLELHCAELDAGVSLSSKNVERHARLEKELQSAQVRLSRLESQAKPSVPSQGTDFVPRVSGESAQPIPKKSADWDW
jgi:hypothetical protein